MYLGSSARCRPRCSPLGGKLQRYLINAGHPRPSPMRLSIWNVKQSHNSRVETYLVDSSSLPSFTSKSASPTML